MIRERGFAGAALLLLVGGWVAACGSDNDNPIPVGGDAQAPQILGCNEFTFESCNYDNVGCDALVTSFDAELEDQANNCSVIVHVECAEGCIESVAQIDALPNVDPDGGGLVGGDSPLGGACASTEDCIGGLTCLTPEGSDWLLGGPASGLCTINCATDVSVCGQYPNSTCVPGSSEDEAYCFEGCIPGPSVGGAKCQGRVDQACLQVSAVAAVCLPSCGSDNQCSDGRFCDITSGVCVDDQPQGDPIGTACDPLAAVNTCAGVCRELATGYAACTGFCTVGLDAPGCGINPATDEILPGAPLCLPLLGANDAVGDTGLCIQRCDCNDNCLHTDSICDGFNDADLSAALTAQGLCLPSSLGAGDAGAAVGLACGLPNDDGGLPVGDGGNSATDSGTVLDGSVSTDSGTSPSDAGDAGDGG